MSSVVVSGARAPVVNNNVPTVEDFNSTMVKITAVAGVIGFLIAQDKALFLSCAVGAVIGYNLITTIEGIRSSIF